MEQITSSASSGPSFQIDRATAGATRMAVPAGDVDDLVVELELQRAGEHVVDLFLGLVAVSVAAFAAGSGWHQSVGERDLLGLEVIGEESHRSGVLPFEDVGHVGDCADCVVAHLCSCAGRAGASGAPRLTWRWVRKSCSRRSDVGRGVSGGGSVGDVAGTEPSRTNRSIPAGVLSTSTRAVSLSTRNVCAHAGRDYANAARVELEAVRAGVYGELPVEHDVALVLRVGVKRRRCVARKEELDQSEAAIDGLSRHPDDRQSAEEPEPLVLACRRTASRPAQLRGVPMT